MKDIVYIAVAAIFAFMVLMFFNCSIVALVTGLINTFGEFGYNTMNAVMEQFQVSTPITVLAAVLIAVHSVHSARLEGRR